MTTTPELTCHAAGCSFMRLERGALQVGFAIERMRVGAVGPVCAEAQCGRSERKGVRCVRR